VKHGKTMLSPAKLRSLRALHAIMRGRRHSVDNPSRKRVLAQVRRLIAQPTRGRSARAVAEYCDVSDRTVRRWLDGEDWPPADQIRAMAAWVRKFDAAAVGAVMSHAPKMLR